MSKSHAKSGAAQAGDDEAGRMSGEDRRRQLIQVAIKLFSRKGFSGTTTREVALAAGVNEAIIFRHFPTKEDLYAAILDFKAGEARVGYWLDEMGEYAARRDDEGLFGLLAARIMEHYRKDLDFMRLMFYSALEGHTLARKFREKQFEPINDFLSDYIAARQREGAFGRTDPAAAVRAFIGMPVYHCLVNYLLECNALKLSEQEAARTFVNIFLDGLRPSRVTVER